MEHDEIENDLTDWRAIKRVTVFILAATVLIYGPLGIIFYTGFMTNPEMGSAVADFLGEYNPVFMIITILILLGGIIWSVGASVSSAKKQGEDAGP